MDNKELYKQIPSVDEIIKNLPSELLLLPRNLLKQIIRDSIKDIKNQILNKKLNKDIDKYVIELTLKLEINNIFEFKLKNLFHSHS